MPSGEGCVLTTIDNGRAYVAGVCARLLDHMVQGTFTIGAHARAAKLFSLLLDQPAVEPFASFLLRIAKHTSSGWLWKQFVWQASIVLDSITTREVLNDDEDERLPCHFRNIERQRFVGTDEECSEFLVCY